jgi:hypothetical protein
VSGLDRWTVTLWNRAGWLAWTGDYATEKEAVAALENARIAAKEIGGRAEMDPAPKEKSDG